MYHSPKIIEKQLKTVGPHLELTSKPTMPTEIGDILVWWIMQHQPVVVPQGFEYDCR